MNVANHGRRYAVPCDAVFGFRLFLFQFKLRQVTHGQNPLVLVIIEITETSSRRLQLCLTDALHCLLKTALWFLRNDEDVHNALAHVVSVNLSSRERTIEFLLDGNSLLKFILAIAVELKDELVFWFLHHFVCVADVRVY